MRTVAARVLLGWVALTLLPILVLRVVPPPASAFMVERWLASRLGAGPPVAIRYDWTPWADIAPAMRLAVVAAEDQRFPSHHGIDVAAVRRALREARTAPRGASTITQQVARNLFLWPGRSWVRKVLEAYFALAIDALWPKRRILEVYLNVAELGDGIYGVGAAGARFFHTTPARLTRDQAARLAAVLPNPRHRRPDAPSPGVQARARWIERQMARLGPAYLAGL